MNTDETLDVEEVAALLRAESSTILQFARRGDLPGARIGKSWVFLRDDVMTFLKLKIAEETAERLSNRNKSPIAFSVPVPKRRRKHIPTLPNLPVRPSG